MSEALELWVVGELLFLRQWMLAVRFGVYVTLEHTLLCFILQEEDDTTDPTREDEASPNCEIE